MSESEKIRNIVSVKPDKMEAEKWLQKIRKAEAEALAAVHRKIFRQMVDEDGAVFTSTLEMQDPETSEQENIVEEEGTYRIQLDDGSALVAGSEANGFHITLGIHSSRLPDDDPFQGFQFVDEENGLEGQQFPRETIN